MNLVKSNVIRIVKGLPPLEPQTVVTLEPDEFVATAPDGMTVTEAQKLAKARLKTLADLVAYDEEIGLTQPRPEPKKRFLKFKMLGLFGHLAVSEPMADDPLGQQWVINVAIPQSQPVLPR